MPTKANLHKRKILSDSICYMCSFNKTLWIEFWLALVYDENLKGEKYSIVYENNCG